MYYYLSEMFNKDTLYKIVPVKDEKKCVTCSLKESERNLLELYDYTGLNNQKWAVHLIKDGKYAFFNAMNNGTMEVPEHEKGACRIQVANADRRNNELWSLEQPEETKYGPTSFHIKSHVGLVMDCWGGKARDGAD